MHSCNKAVCGIRLFAGDLVRPARRPGRAARPAARPAATPRAHRTVLCGPRDAAAVGQQEALQEGRRRAAAVWRQGFLAWLGAALTPPTFPPRAATLGDARRRVAMRDVRGQGREGDRGESLHMPSASRSWWCALSPDEQALASPPLVSEEAVAEHRAHPETMGRTCGNAAAASKDYTTAANTTHSSSSQVLVRAARLLYDGELL